MTCEVTLVSAGSHVGRHGRRNSCDVGWHVRCTSTHDADLGGVSIDDPRFSNYINGSNAIYRNAEAWANGQIYTGWVLVGGYSTAAQDVGRAVVQALVDGKTNPSLAYMSPGTGRLSLTGHLLRNHARLACP